jgi:UDPglucose 6-dehydrogenase
VHDPAAMTNVQKIYGNRLHYENNAYDVCSGADALVIHTEWNEYRSPDFERLAGLLRERVIFDGRNLYNPLRLREHKLEYHPIGRPLEAVVDPHHEGYF